MLDERELAFLQTRRRFARWWNAVGGLLLVALGGSAVWLRVDVPALMSPTYAAKQISAGALPQSSLELMAVLLPVAMWVLFVVTAVVIGFGFAVFTNERRYQSIIEALQTGLSEGRGT